MSSLVRRDSPALDDGTNRVTAQEARQNIDRILTEADISNLDKYDQSTVNTLISDALETIKGGVSSDRDTLKKQNDIISSLENFRDSITNVDADTVVNTLSEIQNAFSQFPESTDLLTQFGLKIDKTSIANNLTETDTTKVLGADQGKILKDLIDTKANTSNVLLTNDPIELNRPASKDFVLQSSGVLIGETETTAHRGDHGKIAYDHTLSETNPHNVNKQQVGLSNVDNTSDLDKPISSATTVALNSKVDQVTGKSLSQNDFTDTLKNKLLAIQEEATRVLIVDNLNSTETDKALSAKQGNVLDLRIDNLESFKVDQVTGKSLSQNDFTDTLKNKLLAIEEEATRVLIVDNLNSTETDKALSAKQGNVLDLRIDNLENSGGGSLSLVDNLTSTSTTEGLTAKQGKVLKDLIDSINTLLLSDNSSLDTVQEIVDFIEINKSTLDTLSISSIAGLQFALDSKVNTIAGKSLSQEDFTTILKNKLEGVENNADVTNTEKVTSAGAVMDSEIDQNIKSLTIVPNVQINTPGNLTTKYVSWDGSDTNNGTINSKYATIAKGLLEVDTNGVINVATAPDIQENLTIDKSCTILGAGENANTILKGTVSFGTTGVISTEIKNFRLEGKVSTTGMGGWRIKDCKINVISGNSIEISGVITNNIIFDRVSLSAGDISITSYSATNEIQIKNSWINGNLTINSGIVFLTNLSSIRTITLNAGVLVLDDVKVITKDSNGCSLIVNATAATSSAVYILNNNSLLQADTTFGKIKRGDATKDAPIYVSGNFTDDPTVHELFNTPIVALNHLLYKNAGYAAPTNYSVSADVLPYHLIGIDSALSLKASTTYVDGLINTINNSINTNATDISNLNTLLTSNDTNLDQLQEIVDFIKQNKTTLDALSVSNIAGLGTSATVNIGTASGEIPVIQTDGKLLSSIIPSSGGGGGSAKPYLSESISETFTLGQTKTINFLGDNFDPSNTLLNLPSGYTQAPAVFISPTSMSIEVTAPNEASASDSTITLSNHLSNSSDQKTITFHALNFNPRWLDFDSPIVTSNVSAATNNSLTGPFDGNVDTDSDYDAFWTGSPVPLRIVWDLEQDYTISRFRYINYINIHNAWNDGALKDVDIYAIPNLASWTPTTSPGSSYLPSTYTQIFNDNMYQAQTTAEANTFTEVILSSDVVARYIVIDAFSTWGNQGPGLRAFEIYGDIKL